MLKIVKGRNAWWFLKIVLLFLFEVNPGRLFPESCEGWVASGKWWHLLPQLCKSSPVGARVCRGDTGLRVGKTDTVCCHLHFSLIYFYHFLLWPSARCTSREFLLGQCGEISIYIIFNRLQRVPSWTHKIRTFMRKAPILEWKFPHMLPTFSWRLNSLMV